MRKEAVRTTAAPRRKTRPLGVSSISAGSSSSTLAMTIYGMTKKRVTPEINAVSTLLFVTVLALLVIVNLREARAERSGEERRPISRKLTQMLDTPKGRSGYSPAPPACPPQ